MEMFYFWKDIIVFIKLILYLKKQILLKHYCQLNLCSPFPLHYFSFPPRPSIHDGSWRRPTKNTHSILLHITEFSDFKILNRGSIKNRKLPKATSRMPASMKAPKTNRIIQQMMPAPMAIAVLTSHAMTSLDLRCFTDTISNV